MKKIAVLLTLIFLSSLMSGCAGDDTSTEKDERITELESELANKTVEINLLETENINLANVLNDAQNSLYELNINYENLSNRLSLAEWHKSNLTFELSEAMELLNNGGSQEIIISLENDIDNLTLQLDLISSEIDILNQEILDKESQINQLTATVTALQSTMNTLTHQIRQKVGRCPLDNPGTEIAVGYDNGDGIISGSELQFTVGECPGNYGMVANVSADGAGPQLMVTMGGNIYFDANDGIHGWEMWRSDGTVIGTYLLKDIRDEECEDDPSNPGEQICNNYSSVYNHDAGQSGTASWPAFWPEIVAGNEKIFFTAFSNSHTVDMADVWVSDGTKAGTKIVKNQWSGFDYTCSTCDFYYIGPSELTIMKSTNSYSDRVVYSVLNAVGGTGTEISNADVTGEELWISDGTPAGTYQLTNQWPEEKYYEVNGANYCCMDDRGGIPREITVKGNTVYFTADTADKGRELYKYHVRSIGGGLFMIKDINPGIGSSTPESLTPISNGGIYFSADNGSSGRELYFGQGDSLNTNIVLDIWPGLNGSNPDNIVVGSEEGVYFTANNGVNGTEIWYSDRTELGTYMIKDININGSSNPSRLVIIENTVFFYADDGIHGRELWRSNGTEEGTYMVKDVYTGPTDSLDWDENFWWDELMIVHKNLIYFVANNESYGHEVWVSDGTEEGTNILVDIVPGANDSWPWKLTSFGDKLLFTIWDGETRNLYFYWDNPGPNIILS
jgi:ELWxxDGT repeat protein